MSETKLLIAVAAVNILFLTQPIHLDDNGMLLLARSVRSSPTQPYAGYNIFFGQELPNFYNTHPPLFPYYLAAILTINPSENLAILRLAMLIPTLFCASALFRLYSRFSSSPWLLSVLTVVTPCFMVVGHSLLSDIFFTAFLLWSLEFYVASGSSPSVFRLFMSSLTLAMGCLVSYQGIFMLPVIGSYEYLTSRRLRKIAALAIGPGSALGIWAYHLHSAYGVSLFAPTVSLYSDLKHKVLDNYIAYLSFLGGSGPFLLFLMGITLLIVGRKRLAPFGGLVISLVMWRAIAPTYSARHAVLLVAMLWCGATILILAIQALRAALRCEHLRGVQHNTLRQEALAADSNHSGSAQDDETVKGDHPSVPHRNLSAAEPRTCFRRDQYPKVAIDGFLGAWILLFFLPFGFMTPFIIARYCLPVFVPAALLIFRVEAIEIFVRSRNIGRVLMVTSLMLGIMVSVADYLMAKVNPQVIPRLASKYGQLRGEVRFAGEFGFRYYMEKNSIPTVKQTDHSLPPGDVILCSRYVGLGLQEMIAEDLFNRCNHIGKLVFPSKFPFRTFNVDEHAGFYCHYSGFLPWSIGGEPLDEVWIYLVTPVGKTELNLEQRKEEGIPNHIPVLQSVTATASEINGYRIMKIECFWLMRSAGGDRFITTFSLNSNEKTFKFEHQWKHDSLPAGIYSEHVEAPIPDDLPPGKYRLNLAMVDKISGQNYGFESHATTVDVPAVLVTAELAPYLDSIPERAGRFVTLKSYLDSKASCNAKFSHPTEIRRLVLYSRLGNAETVTQGRKVFEILLRPDDGEDRRIDVRAGLETAEWSADRPDVAAELKHAKAPIVHSFQVGESATYQGHIYGAEWLFEPPVKVAELVIKQEDVSCITIVDGITLFTLDR